MRVRSSKVVAATVRDATHTLDGILDNQTVLPVAEHTTDTHGYTEMIFGAYELLGLRFAPSRHEPARSPAVTIGRGGNNAAGPEARAQPET